MVHAACPGLELVSCELLANPAAVADVLVLNVHKTPSSALPAKKAMVKTLVRPLPSLSSQQQLHANTVPLCTDPTDENVSHSHDSVPLQVSHKNL
jgi:hypothetical protein